MPVFRDKDVYIVEGEFLPMTMYFECPSKTSPWPPTVFSLLIHMVNKTQRSLHRLQYLSNKFNRRFDGDAETYRADKDMRYFKRVAFRTINPSTYSPTELTSYLVSLVDDIKPTALYIHNVAVSWSTAAEDPKGYIRMLSNLVYELRGKGVDVFRIGSFIDPLLSNINKAISSHVITIKCADTVCSNYIVAIEKFYTLSGITLSFKRFKENNEKLIQLVKERKQIGNT
ncbi:MAG: hypothetical protein QXT53_07970 [Ignisphaera sp.]